MDDQYNCHVGKTKVLLKKSYRRRFLLGRAPSGVACRVALSAQTFLPCKKVTAAIAHATKGAGHSPAPPCKTQTSSAFNKNKRHAQLLSKTMDMHEKPTTILTKNN
jgi:hypothetical protein